MSGRRGRGEAGVRSRLRPSGLAAEPGGPLAGRWRQGWWRRWGGRAGAGRPGGRGGATLEPSVLLPWPPPAPCVAPSPPGRAPGPRTDGPWRRPPPASPCSPPPRSRWPPGPRPAPASVPDPVSELPPHPPLRPSCAEPARGAQLPRPCLLGLLLQPLSDAPQTGRPLSSGPGTPPDPFSRPRPAPCLPQYLPDPLVRLLSDVPPAGMSPLSQDPAPPAQVPQRLPPGRDAPPPRLKTLPPRQAPQRHPGPGSPPQAPQRRPQSPLPPTPANPESTRSRAGTRPLCPVPAAPACPTLISEYKLRVKLTCPPC